jgi:hypothetical protein
MYPQPPLKVPSDPSALTGGGRCREARVAQAAGRKASDQREWAAGDETSGTWSGAPG